MLCKQGGRLRVEVLVIKTVMGLEALPPEDRAPEPCWVNL